MLKLLSSKETQNFLYKLKTTLEQVKLDTTIFLIVTPIIAAYGLYTTKFVWQTWVVGFVSMWLGQLAMTTVYHRFYSHRTFKCSRLVELPLLFIAAGDFSMSALDWVRDHRVHHRYTDTDKDPYNIKRGFWFAHVGWLVWKRKTPNIDVSDLERDPILIFQHEWVNSLGFLFGWGIPTLICGLLWGDWRGGFFIASVFKTVVQHHSIFCINSLAHYMGEGTYNDQITPKDNFICALVTMGEGYHNFHHEFPNDYRNGVHWSSWDPTKWFIALLEWLGLAWDLTRTPSEQIKLSKIQMVERNMEKEKRNIFTGTPIEELPYYTRDEVAELCAKKGQKLVIEGNLVFDVSEFASIHPGGSGFITSNIGKDITKNYNGGVYGHSNTAKNLLQTLRCGRLPKQE